MSLSGLSISFDTLQKQTPLRHTGWMASTATKLEPKGRLSAVDWEEAALATLAESGLGTVAVESLARRLGVTKGSFYWHFATREALIKAALERWEKSDEDIVVAQLERSRTRESACGSSSGASAARCPRT